MKRYYLYAITCIIFCCKKSYAQANTRLYDSLKVIALPDIEITNSPTHLVASSGTEDNKTIHIISPGGGYAIRFLAPKSNYHELRQLRLYLKNTAKLKEGQLCVRIASVTTDGSPANDSLLPPVILNTIALQQTRRHITLQYKKQLFVPEHGFFYCGRRPWAKY